MACLKILEGHNAGQTLELGDEALIGRSLSNAICLPDSRASRRHARIMRANGGYAIEDLKSANGTFVRGAPIPPSTPVPLQDGDEIVICSTRLVFHTAETVPIPAPPTREPPPTGEFEDLSVKMLEESEQPPPEVNMTLDASMSMASVRVEDTRTEKGLQEVLKRLEAMSRISESLGTVMDTQVLMGRIMDFIFHLFPKADRAFIMLRDEQSGQLVPVAAKRRSATAGPGRAKEQVAISRTIVREVDTKKRSILTSDAMSDDRFGGQVSIMNLSIRSMMCAPLLVKDEVLGLIQVDTQSGVEAFTEQDLHLLTGVSAEAAIAVKNAQLYQAVETETARRTSLQRYFSPNMVEMMMDGDLSTELGGNAYRGTVFFSDIIGFTRMSETMPPAQVVANLNRYFHVMQQLIYDNGGNVDKFSGDAIMAFWGVPRSLPEDERRAALTGVQMQAQLWTFNQGLALERQLPIHMGIGLNTGEFVAGNIGSKDKIEFTLIGDNVNLAARIQALAGRTQVFAAETTWQAMQEDVCAIRLPPVPVKGKTYPTRVYSIRAVRLREDAHDWAAALACEVLDPQERVLGPGMVTAMRGAGEDRRLQLDANAQLEPDMPVALRFNVSEYHELLVLSATVASCATKAQGESAHTTAELAGLRGDAALALLAPGSALETDLGWNRIRRE